MADTNAVAPLADKKAAEGGDKTPQNATGKRKHRRNNYPLAKCGIMRFSRAQMNRRRSLFKKKLEPTPKKKRVVAKEELYKIKPVSGEKNGGERKVLVKKPRRLVPLMERKRKQKSTTRRVKIPRLKRSLTPGTIVIILTGQHRGKHAVFLKQLRSGLILVTGPFTLNGCPLRRTCQSYVIGTCTKLDISGVKLPRHINDSYFQRAKKQKKTRKLEGDIFAAKKEEYAVSEQRKVDQKAVDKMIMDVINKHPENSMLKGYLRSLFSLKTNQYPHKMVF